MPAEWICSRHWAMVSKRLKTRRARINRLFRKAHHQGRIRRLNDLWQRTWLASKNEATERAGGIS